MKNIKYESYLTEKTHLHIQDGNRKIGKGIYSINLLSGDTPLTLKDGTRLTNISGTCKGCCDSCKDNCYAIRTQIFRNNNMKAWADNTILATQDIDAFFTELQQFIDRSMVAAIRYHSFGEIPSYEYLLKIVETAKNNKNIIFYLYTKRFSWIEKYIEENSDIDNGKYFPENLIVNVSIWHKNYKNPYGLPEFIYDDGTEEDISKLPHCPAVDKDGHDTGVTCAKCKHCLKAKNGSKIAVYSH